MPEERHWKEDVVYLYQFGRSPTFPSVSPFSLKLETFLRLYKIPYENRFVVMKRSKYGLLPYIELNGETIGDSQLIMEKLKEKFNIQEFASPEVSAQNRALQRMVENHSFFVLNKFKILDHLNEISRLFIKENSAIPSFLVPIGSQFIKMTIGKKAKKRQSAALGMYSDEDFRLLLRLDLETLRDFLADKKFFGGEKMTSTDCSVFGMLVPCLYLPLENLPQKLLQSELPTLVRLIERVKQELWKDDFETKKE